MTHNRQNSWHNVLGTVVEDHQNRITFKKGFVDEANEAHEVRVEPKHRGGTHAYPMVWPANRPGSYGWNRPANARHDRLRYRNRSVVTERA